MKQLEKWYEQFMIRCGHTNPIGTIGRLHRAVLGPPQILLGSNPVAREKG